MEIGLPRDFKDFLKLLRVQEIITFLFIALRFRLYLLDQIELNRKRSQSYTEYSVSEDRVKMA